MQTHPPLPAASPPTPTPTIHPGPIILLALLPAIPLLLFSLGARPPDTSALLLFPLTTNDLLVTTSLVCLAGGSVLLGGVYPEVGGWVWGWVKDGGEGVGMGGWGGQNRMVEEQSTGQSAVPRRPPPPEWIWDERFRRWMRVPSLLVRPSVPVKCKYKDFEFFFSE